jgi:hypothetical protein
MRYLVKENTFIRSTLQSTNVFLSLNKRKRWLLPATISHMIKTGSFDEAKTMVSLLERHKLKRKANCVSFVCNQGRIRHVAPKQKKYFSFNLSNIGNTQSIKQLRRQKAEALLIFNSQKSEMIKKAEENKAETLRKRNKAKVRVIEIFTEDEKKKTSGVKIVSQPGYRLEVLHPCPQTCSLNYNPKYSNAIVQFDEDGGMELKSEKRIVKKGRRHRRRFTLKIWICMTQR